MKKMNFLLFGLSLVTTAALANLNVIADVGGEDASPYLKVLTVRRGRNRLRSCRRRQHRPLMSRRQCCPWQRQN